MFSDLSRLFGKKVGLIVHSGCDVDSFCSAAAIMLSLKGKAKCSICVPDHLNAQAKVFAEKLNINFLVEPNLCAFDSLVCVDFCSKHMLGSLSSQFDSFKGEKFVIDHHECKVFIVPKKNSCINPNYVSCTELVFKLLLATKEIKVSKKSFACIAAGIITDSAGFSVADKETFSIMSVALINSGYSYYELCSLFYAPKDFSEKIALLKAFKRSKIFCSGDKVIAVSEVSAFEADAASSLVRLGADIAFCGYSSKGKVRISGRANQIFVKSLDFDLVGIFNKLKTEFGGECGGHKGAAAFNSIGSDPWPFLLKCAELSHSEIKKQFPNYIYKEYD
ncbi:MAG: DHH family phosphoesterase [Candidatus Diapherotrites archaeon]